MSNSSDYYESVRRMRELASGEEFGDAEDWHSEADDLLCEELIRLGRYELVKLYREVDKWYA